MGFLPLAVLFLTAHPAPVSKGAAPESLSVLLELSGDTARIALERAANDSTHGDAARGEAVFRLGQFHYASGQFRKAIPQFRKYATAYPQGPWIDPAAYWMAHACLQYAQQQRDQRGYLDTGLRYLNDLEARNRPNGHYLPIALSARARLLLARGWPKDTSIALSALKEARKKAPPEETPAALLLTAQALPFSKGDSARVWEDSILWSYPTSLEASWWLSRLSTQPITAPKPSPKPPPIVKPIPPLATKAIPPAVASKDFSPSLPPRFSLLLGNFQTSVDAERFVKSLAENGIRVRVEKSATAKTPGFRILQGIYPNGNAARLKGDSIFGALFQPFQVIALEP